MKTVLVVDDKEMLRDSVAVTLQRAGFAVLAAADGAQGLEIVAKRRPDAVVTDLRMPGLSGIELIEKIRELDDDMPVVLMTAYGTIETAVQAMKLGAFDYVTKPFEGDELLVSVKRAIEHARLKRENAVLRLAASDASQVGPVGPVGSAKPGEPHGADRVLGSSSAMAEIREQIAVLAESQGTVMISGESGTGKEVVAIAIHEQSLRAEQPYLALNCAAMSESLMESELFGHEKGAFTGADQLRKGRFELAHNGTLLLDEVSEVKPHIQAKLLRVLQERAFERVGSSTTIGVDVRVIATTNRNLTDEVAQKRFREDLFFRLNVLPIHLPPLRQRREDVDVLAPHFVAKICAREGKQAKFITSDAMDLLRGYGWPGNVRELQNICERAVVLSRGEQIEASLIGPWLMVSAPFEHLTPVVNGAASSIRHMSASPSITGGTRPLSDIEREVIVETLVRFNGHRQKTARALGIGVRTLGLKLKKWKEQKLVSESL